MIANRSKDTAPEIAVRSILHARGMRYRTHLRPEPGLRRTADIVFPRRRIAVFIDGCFWHGCPEHYMKPKSNVDYWLPKIDGNRARDAETSELLSIAGWTVLRFWEHEDPVEVADAISQAVASVRIDESRAQAETSIRSEDTPSSAAK